ncbi:MAG: helix-turn-helix domain-containing protein, partial [Candidatus Nanoarchaeia archaeon]|nr:helix-turn-helix domain-containing protein [Candidatus Nanoarchaeia archaeon]
MGKGSTKNLLVNVLRVLSNKPKSITEISKETGLDRISISQYLKILNESGFIIEEKIGKNKKYFISCNHNLRENTFFNLFIDEKTNELIDSLYHLIQKKWLEISKKRILKTTAQKIIYDVIKDCDLKIPNGWYIYGGICVKPFDCNKDYNYKGVLNNVKNCVNETVLEYSKNNFEYESKQLQYKKSGKELYDIKEEILRLLYSKNFSKNSMYIFQKLFSKFWRLTSLLDKFCDDILNDFDTLLIDITKEWDNFINEDNEMNFSGFKQKLISSFET